MGFLDVWLISIGLYLVAILFTILAGWVTINSLLVGNPFNRVTIFLWVIAGILWTIIGIRTIVNYILNDRTAQFIILVVLIMAILFVPSKKSSKKNGNSK